MTVEEAITCADELEPNQYSCRQKKCWLTQLDGRIFDELLKGRPDCAVTDYPVYTAQTQTLLVPAPYAWSIYTAYLQAMIALENAETVRYSQQMLMFNTAYSEYSNYVNRIMSPRSPAQNRIRF